MAKVNFDTAFEAAYVANAKVFTDPVEIRGPQISHCRLRFTSTKAGKISVEITDTANNVVPGTLRDDGNTVANAWNSFVIPVVDGEKVQVKFDQGGAGTNLSAMLRAGHD